MLGFLFNQIIGKLPADKKEELLKRFNEVLNMAIKAGVEGAVAGVTKK